MKKEDEELKGAVVEEDDDFLAFPIHNVVGVFEDCEAAASVVKELRESGFAENEITSYRGSAGAEKLDFSGSRHGSMPALLRALQHVGPDRTYLERHEAFLSEGHCLVMVHVSDKRHKARAADIMHRHTNRRVTYFGTWLIEQV